MAASTFGSQDEHFGWYEQLLGRYGLERQIPVSQALEDPEDLQRAFSYAGFTQVGIVEEVFDCVYEDERDWWTHLWSTADRGALETLSQQEQEALRQEAYDGIDNYREGSEIRVPYHVLFTLAKKPAPKQG